MAGDSGFWGLQPWVERLGRGAGLRDVREASCTPLLEESGRESARSKGNGLGISGSGVAVLYNFRVNPPQLEALSPKPSGSAETPRP